MTYKIVQSRSISEAVVNITVLDPIYAHKAFEPTWRFAKCSTALANNNSNGEKMPIIETILFRSRQWKWDELVTYWNARACASKHTAKHFVHRLYPNCFADPFQYQTLHIYIISRNTLRTQTLRITTSNRNCTGTKCQQRCSDRKKARGESNGSRCARLFFAVTFHRHHMIGKSKCRTNSTIIMISVCRQTASAVAQWVATGSTNNNRIFRAHCKTSRIPKSTFDT